MPDFIVMQIWKANREKGYYHGFFMSMETVIKLRIFTQIDNNLQSHLWETNLHKISMHRNNLKVSYFWKVLVEAQWLLSN